MKRKSPTNIFETLTLRHQHARVSLDEEREPSLARIPNAKYHGTQFSLTRRSALDEVRAKKWATYGIQITERPADDTGGPWFTVILGSERNATLDFEDPAQAVGVASTIVRLLKNEWKNGADTALRDDSDDFNE